MVAESDSVSGLQISSEWSPALQNCPWKTITGSDQGGSQGATEKQKDLSGYTEGKIYFKQLAHGTVGRVVGKPKICRQPGRLVIKSGCFSLESEFCRAAGWKHWQAVSVMVLRRIPSSENFDLCA